MSVGAMSTKARKSCVLGLGLAAGLVALDAPGSAQAPQREITVTIRSVKALDKLDVFSKADFFARVRIAGETISTPVVKQADQITPNWVVTKRVPAGRHNIKLEILDKDLTKADLIDVNRLVGKRDLDFTIDTRNCTVGGFTNSYRCGEAIVRAGTENKKAEVTFVVDVR